MRLILLVIVMSMGCSVGTDPSLNDPDSGVGAAGSNTVEQIEVLKPELHAGSGGTGLTGAGSGGVGEPDSGMAGTAGVSGSGGSGGTGGSGGVAPGCITNEYSPPNYTDQPPSVAHGHDWCDGRDNDCDGAIDESPMDDGSNGWCLSGACTLAEVNAGTCATVNLHVVP